MPVLLPVLPALASIKPRLISYRADLTPALGGPMQRVNRVGSRFAVDVQMPSLAGDCARAWLASRMKAEATNDVLRLVWPETDFVLDYQGVQVDGSGQAGTQLAVKGLGAGYEIPGGRFMSILYEDGYRLHMITDTVIAGDDGRAVLSLAPMLRKSPLDSYSVHFNPVFADVLADGATVDWELQLKRWTSFSVTLTEFQ